MLNEKVKLLTEYGPLTKHAEGRKLMTKRDPLLFALLYLPHHLKGDATNNQITLSEFHEALIEYAKEWMSPLGNMRQYRDAFIAPRECGKSTWLFLMLPLWAAAHEHVKFVSAFSDSATQAENHLATFKRELDTNQLLRNDYPTLCTPATRTVVARNLADNRGQIIQKNDFVFMARGVDSAVAGMKVGYLRPEVIILDDIEPGESNYSPHQVNKRLSTLQDVIFPLNAFARVVLVGTTTMSGSIIHQCVQKAKGVIDDTNKWIIEENIEPHYFPAIVTSDTGEERSLWPAKWPLQELQSMRHTRSFLKNYMNDPLDVDGAYWSPEDIRIHNIDDYGTTILSVDPAVTSKDKSDYTGLAVVSRHPTKPELYVRYATHVKVSPQDLRTKAIELMNRFPEIVGILVETNQGGELWDSVFGGLGVKVRTIHQKASKEIRASKALVHYERGRVYHTGNFPVLESEMLSFPMGTNDDVVDAVVTAILWHTAKKQSPSAKQASYV